MPLLSVLLHVFNQSHVCTVRKQQYNDIIAYCEFEIEDYYMKTKY